MAAIKNLQDGTKTLHGLAMKRTAKHGRATSKAKAARSQKSTTMIQKAKSQSQPGVADPLMTIDEVAALLGIHHDTVSTMHNAGKMPKGLKLGHRTVRFRRSDIEFWIEHGCRSAAVTKALKEAAGK